VNEPEQLRWELGLLKQEFPDAVLYEARLEWRLGERSDHPGIVMERAWSREFWTFQVDNETASGGSFVEAIAELRERLALKAQRPTFAERVAAVLRDIPEEGFERDHVVMAARAILEKERRGR
jgi:hypothetical protein